METLGYEMTQFSPLHGGAAVDPERQFRAAAAAGFDWYGIEVWTIRSYLANGGSLERLANVAADCRLECGQLQTLFAPVPEHVGPIVEDLVAAARVLRPATVQIIARRTTDESVESFRTSSARIREAHPATIFAIEYLPIHENNTARLAMEFVRATGVEGFGLNLDTWHYFQGPEDWSDLEELAPEDIVHLQFSDHGPLREPVDLGDEMLNRRVLPGDGCFDLARFFEIVRAKGYAGRAGVELNSEPMRSMSPEAFAEASYRAGLKFWGHS